MSPQATPIPWNTLLFIRSDNGEQSHNRNDKYNFDNDNHFKNRGRITIKFADEFIPLLTAHYAHV